MTLESQLLSDTDSVVACQNVAAGSGSFYSETVFFTNAVPLDTVVGLAKH